MEWLKFVLGSSVSNLSFVHWFKLRQQSVRECQRWWARVQSLWFRAYCSGSSGFRFTIKMIRSVRGVYCSCAIQMRMSTKNQLGANQSEINSLIVSSHFILSVYICFCHFQSTCSLTALLLLYQRGLSCSLHLLDAIRRSHSCQDHFFSSLTSFLALGQNKASFPQSCFVSLKLC